MERRGGTLPASVGGLDSWRDRAEVENGLRIDQIWCSRALPIARSRVLFDGVDGPIVSDHFGLMAETG